MNLRRLIWLIVIQFCPLVSSGQNFPLDRIFYLNQPFLNQQQNHPYLLQKDQPAFYQGGLGYTSREGVRNQPFDSQHTKQAYFHSESVMSLGNWMLSGNFRYIKTLKSLRPYLLQSPFWNEIPYKLLDLDTQPWSGDEVSFKVSLSSPLYGRKKQWQTFGNLGYDVGSNNRNAEPRPLAINNHYRIKLGQSYNLTAQFSIGAGFQVLAAQEENQIGSFAVQDVKLYLGRGWGTFSKNTYPRFERSQSMKSQEGFLFLKLDKDHLIAFTEFTLTIGTYSARDGIAFPVDGGSVRIDGVSWSGGIDLRFEDSGGIQSLVTVDSEKTSGSDPIFKAVNVAGNTLRVAWTNVAELGTQQDWQVEWDFQYQHRFSEDLAAREESTITEFSGKLSGIKRFKIGTSSLYLNPSVLASIASSDIAYQQNNEISSLLLGAQQDFYSRPLIEPGLGVKFLVPLSQGNTLMLGSGYSHRLSNDFPLSEFSLVTQLIL